MARATFETNPVDLRPLLEDCHNGAIQLPDFQRGWVWDEERIRSLIASISRAFPVGALMSLSTGGPAKFKPRPVEGAPPDARRTVPESLLLDGQQRVTSLYQATLRNHIVETVNSKNKKVKRWFYIDVRKALDPLVDREEAILGVPEDRIVRKEFGREILLDLSEPQKEYALLMFPLTQVFDWYEWQDGFYDHWRGQMEEVHKTFTRFRQEVLEHFKMYRVPVIRLDRETSKEAVCVVFEKVNTGGKPLDAFELVTAMYAAEGHELRKDWYGDDGAKGRCRRFADTLRLADAEVGILGGVSNTDFLQAISLFHTRDRRRAAENAGKEGKELPAVACNRQALLNLPLEAYKQYEKPVEEGFVRAAKFLHIQRIYRIYDLPYQSQIVPLATILADIGDSWQHDANRNKLVRWFWSGVFGELYGSTVETRIARDFVEVPLWLGGAPPPSTVSEAIFRPDRLKTMRMRISAAYKGVNALLMKEGARDFRSGQEFDHTVFFGENVDIHHIFPRDWCKKSGIDTGVYDSIINKTPLSDQTNRILGGAAPSEYLSKLESGDASPERLDSLLASHLIDPARLRANDFDGFMATRQKRLLALVEQAMGKAAYGGAAAEEGEDVEADADTIEAKRTVAVA